MANRLKGEVEIPVMDGDLSKTYVMRLDVNAMIATQDDWGFTNEEGDAKFMVTLINCLSNPRAFSIKKVRALVKNGLKANHPDITVEEAGRVITAIGLPKLGAILAETVKWCLPEQEKPAADEKPPTGKADAASPGQTPS